ncbi:MAG: LysR family transcriptional regulator, partial [Microlunatus sp.]|nr:LysR family transcriptional regulator [Microlunatus sp.]
MERRDMEIFLMLADELHFGRTAERLHLSTARVSQTIKQLERHYGVLLFERTSRRVALTPTGSQLYADLTIARRELHAAEDRIAAAGRGLRGTLTVGFVGARAGQRMLAAAELLHTTDPDCDVRIRESPLSTAIEDLKTEVVQLLTAMFPVRDRELSCSPTLFQERRRLAVPAGDTLTERAAVTRADVI